jgi:AcrR family transcriptional regulator
MSRKARADRAQIIAIATELADLHGIEGVTLAEIASRLAVRIPSLYNHVAGLDDVRRGIVLLGLAHFTDALRAAVIGRSGDDAIRSLAHAYRAFARAHPGWYGAVEAAPRYANAAVEAAGVPPVQIAVAVLAAYGLQADDALHAVRALRSVVHGFVSLEQHQGFGLALDLDESYARLIEIFIRGLHSAEYRTE